MSKHGTSTVLGAAVLGLALVASPAFAANLFTVNQTNATGVTGSKAFVPAFISSNDPTGVGGTLTNGIYIPYLGTMKPCDAMIGTTNSTTGCARWGQASIEAWSKGLYYDPRFGTPFIPPSGDHHRTGYRMLMQPSFSGGAWLTGFAPLNQRFPFFPEVGSAGPGGDVGLALANSSAESGLNGILALADAHGEPLTTGKFPRYWPHERQAWVDTLMVKYTAGGTQASGFNQNLRSSVGFSREATRVRWRAMTNLSGHFFLSTGGDTDSDGCGDSGWCEFYVKDTNNDGTPESLWVAKDADGNTETTGESAAQITSSTRLDTMAALGNGGKVLANKTLSGLEMLPTLIEDRMSQVDESSSVSNASGRQSLLSQFRVYSGPNVHSEEGADPYSWVICGTRGKEYGEDKSGSVACGTDGMHKGAIETRDTTINNGYGYNLAIVYNSNFQGQRGDSVLLRMGRDLNPARLNQNLATGGSNAFTGIDSVGDPNQTADVYVVCTGVNDTANRITIAGVAYTQSSCLSSPGNDGMYGTSDDGTIFYKEALENGLRGWIRDTNAHTFSFLGAAVDGVANFGLTQLVQQETEGFLMSCLNCSPHSLPLSSETVTYTFDWPGLPLLANPGHPAVSGSFTVLP